MDDSTTESCDLWVLAINLIFVDFCPLALTNSNWYCEGQRNIIAMSWQSCVCPCHFRYRLVLNRAQLGSLRLVYRILLGPLSLWASQGEGAGTRVMFTNLPRLN